MDENRIYYEIKMYLDFLGKDYQEKIPCKIYNVIIEKSSNYCLKNPDKKIILDDFEKNGKKALSKDARILLFYIDYNYFAETPDEKRILSNLLKESEKKQAYKSFEIRKSKSNDEIKDEENLSQMYERIKLLKKFF